MLTSGRFPGRLVGVSIDSRGNRAYRLALQTREQHIRREKATSNICTAQVLLAVIASMYAVYHGPEGLTAIARAHSPDGRDPARRPLALGWNVQPSSIFDTVTVEAGERREAILECARKAGINLRDIPPAQGASRIGISVDETTTAAIVEAVWCAFGDTPEAAARRTVATRRTAAAIPDALARTSAFLTHPVFHQHRSETELLRYMRRLADRDLALDRSMIPLGSCTMKLNATAEMMPLTWPEFADLHPFAPSSQAQGYAAVIDELREMLGEITGYDAISFQPNSGAQGEYAGLLAIRAYHRARGQGHRNVCLIPASAHGTNPASARMAGMEVVVVRCNDSGNVDIDDLRAKASAHAGRLAAIMITYPSTHGVFEEDIRAICDSFTRHGGQVYLDGANLNAQVGLARPGRLRRRCRPSQFAQDVLHSTWRWRAGHGADRRQGASGAVSAWPSAMSDGPARARRSGFRRALWFRINLVIPWLYCLMMGGDGLTAAQRWRSSMPTTSRSGSTHYPLLYKGRSGRVAHECIVDLRQLKNSAGVTSTTLPSGSSITDFMRRP